MAGTNAVAIKRAVVDALRVAPGIAGGGLDGTDVQVQYAYDPKTLERESISPGKVTWQHTVTGQGGGIREERLNVDLHMRALLPGGTAEEADLRLLQLGTAVEDFFAEDPAGGGLDVLGLMAVRVTGGEMENGHDDDGAISVGIWRVGFISTLR